MMNKEGKDVRAEDQTPETYIVKPGEERFYHCVVDTPQYDPHTGRKISVARVQKFGRRSFEGTIERSLKRMGYTVTVLHDPNVWIASQAARQMELKAAQEQAEADRKAEERAALKEEIMKELKAEGVIPEAGEQERMQNAKK